MQTITEYNIEQLLRNFDGSDPLDPALVKDIFKNLIDHIIEKARKCSSIYYDQNTVTEIANHIKIATIENSYINKMHEEGGLERIKLLMQICYYLAVYLEAEAIVEHAKMFQLEEKIMDEQLYLNALQFLKANLSKLDGAPKLDSLYKHILRTLLGLTLLGISGYAWHAIATDAKHLPGNFDEYIKQKLHWDTELTTNIVNGCMVLLTGPGGLATLLWECCRLPVFNKPIGFAKLMNDIVSRSSPKENLMGIFKPVPIQVVVTNAGQQHPTTENTPLMQAGEQSLRMYNIS